MLEKIVAYTMLNKEILVEMALTDWCRLHAPDKLLEELGLEKYKFKCMRTKCPIKPGFTKRDLRKLVQDVS